MSLWSRIRNTLRPEALDRELEAEIQAHIDEMREAGVAKRDYGNTLRYREESRDIKSLPWLESIVADVRFGWRRLLKKKTSTALAILSLGLGVGATTSVFRLIEAGFLRPLAIRDAGSLYFLRYAAPGVDSKLIERDSFSYPEMLAMRAALRDRAEVLMVSFADRQDISYGDPADVEKVSRQYVSGSLFEDFGLRPAAGRLFGPESDNASADHRIAVISYSYWQQRFGLDPGAVGRTFRYSGENYKIVGVLEPAFTGTSTGAFTDVFLPLLANERATRGPQAEHWAWARILVHLKRNASPEAAQGMLRAAFSNHRGEVAKGLPAGTPKVFIDAYLRTQLHLLRATRGVSNFHRDYFVPLSILAGTALLVLLLSCASVANLLTAQSAARAKEMALRISIGAGRGRLIQLLLMECSILAMMATVLGLLFSWWVTPFVVANLNPPDNPVRLHLEIDARVLLMGSLLSFGTTLLFGLLPAFHASSLNPIEAIKSAFADRRRLRLMRTLVAAQVAFCFLVCLVASLMIASLHRLREQPLGFTPERVLLVETEAAGEVPSPEIWNRLVDGATRMRGVKQAALSGWTVQNGGATISDMQVGDRPLGMRGPFVLPVSPGWFSTMKIALREGRDFNRQEADPVIIINEKFARDYFGGRSPYGERIRAGDRYCRVIGVSSDIRMATVRDDVRATVYVSFVDMRTGTLTLRIESGVDEAGLEKLVRQWVVREFPQLRVNNVRPQMDLIRVQTVRERLLAALSVFFGIVALMLAGMGLYAVLACSVSHRAREIAIRLALGARAIAIAGTLAREIAGVLVLGAGVGLAIGLSAQRLIRSFLFEVSGSDPGVLGAASLALLTVCILAAAVPLARALRTDPARTLRSE